MNKIQGLFWFRHDLRLADMPALSALIETVTNVTFVVSQPNHNCDWLLKNSATWSTASDKSQMNNAFGELSVMGNDRKQFHQQCIDDLKYQLSIHGHELIELDENPVEHIQRLVEQLNISHIGCAEYAGINERNELNRLMAALPKVTFFNAQANLLFDEADLPFAMADIPLSFSKFRRLVEKHCTPRAPIRKSVLPVSQGNGMKQTQRYLPQSATCTSPYSTPEYANKPLKQFFGGATAGQQQVDYYFTESQLVSNYKQTRNGLEGWDYSSKLSAWLALGCLSPRWVFAELQKYEAQFGGNESTYWLYFELLWREYFHWLHRRYPKHWFLFTGIQNKSPETNFYAQKFINWCRGETGFAIVDACMRQLNATGYMSNRGRQLVASCFVHELGLDWRYGATYFEAKLVDYDVASNYGNWLYLAGVGTDPRGHRKFDLAKQSAQYDADGAFRQRWLA